MNQGSELDFGVVLICLSKLAKNLALLTLPDSQRISVRMKRQFISISVVRHCEPIPANKISCDQTVQFAPSDARAAFQFVPFGRSVSVINCDWEKRKRRVQLVWNEHLHKKGGGVGARRECLLSRKGHPHDALFAANDKTSGQIT